jgi:multiple sugar transport system permease protein
MCRSDFNNCLHCFDRRRESWTRWALTPRHPPGPLVAARASGMPTISDTAIRSRVERRVTRLRWSSAGGRSRKRVTRLSTRDRIAVSLMVGIPLALVVGFVWLPTLASILLSFTSWDGIGGLGTIKWVGFRNYDQIFNIYPAFFPALRHNIYWLLVLAFIPTVFGLFLAYLLDKNLRGSSIYQSAFYLPVVISLAVVGLMWELIYAPEEGIVNNLLGRTSQTNLIDWLGDPSLNLWAVLVAASWRHAGYVMILYLAGMKSVDPALREAAAIDGASEWRAFRTVVFPALKPINVVVAVITVIESLRAFDIVYVINRGRNGLELLSTLVTDNIVGEASRIGYGSAIGVILLVIALVPIITYVAFAFREEDAGGKAIVMGVPPDGGT